MSLMSSCTHKLLQQVGTADMPKRQALGQQLLEHSIALPTSTCMTQGMLLERVVPLLSDAAMKLARLRRLVFYFFHHHDTTRKQSCRVLQT